MTVNFQIFFISRGIQFHSRRGGGWRATEKAISLWEQQVHHHLRVHSLYFILNWTGIRCSDFNKGVTQQERGERVTTIAKEFRTPCSSFVSRFGTTLFCRCSSEQYFDFTTCEPSFCDPLIIKYSTYRQTLYKVGLFIKCWQIPNTSKAFSFLMKWNIMYQYTKSYDTTTRKKSMPTLTNDRAKYLNCMIIYISYGDKYPK